MANASKFNFFIFVHLKTKLSIALKICLISLIMAVVLFSQFGSGYLYLFQRNAIKKEVRKKLEHGIHMDRLFSFDLSKLEQDPTFIWEDSKEFHYQNGLYDIVERKGNIAICYLDIKEKALMDAYNALNSKSSTNKSKNKINFEIKLYFNFHVYSSNFLSYLNFNFYSSILKPDSGFLFQLDSPPDKLAF